MPDVEIATLGSNCSILLPQPCPLRSQVMPRDTATPWSPTGISRQLGPGGSETHSWQYPGALAVPGACFSADTEGAFV